MVIDMQRETRGASSRLRFGHDVMLAASRIKWAEPELRGLAALVKEGDRVIDVGAAHGMYTIPSYCDFAWSMSPVWPKMTDVSTYTGYDGSCTADVTS